MLKGGNFWMVIDALTIRVFVCFFHATSTLAFLRHRHELIQQGIPVIAG